MNSAKHHALKEAATGKMPYESVKRARKGVKNFESMRAKGRKTHDILAKEGK